VADLAAALEADTGVATDVTVPLQSPLAMPCGSASPTLEADKGEMMPAAWSPAEENAAALVAASQRPAPLRLALAAAPGAPLLRISTTNSPGIGVYIDGYDALMPVLDPIAITAAAAHNVDRHKARLPAPDAVGLEIVLATDAGFAHLCGLQDRPAYCSLVFPPGAVALPGSAAASTAGHSFTRLYEVFHPKLAGVAFRAPEDQTHLVSMVQPASGQVPKVPYLRGVATSTARFLFAQHVAWALDLPTVIHVVSAHAVTAGHPHGLAASPHLLPPSNYVVRTVRDLTDCDAPFATSLVHRLYNWLGLDVQRAALRAYLQRLLEVGARREVLAPLSPRRPLAYNLKPSIPATCESPPSRRDPAIPSDALGSLSQHAPEMQPGSRLCRLLALRQSTLRQTDANVTAVLGILSHNSNKDLRDAMRTHLWRRAGAEYGDIRHVFLLDQPPEEPDLADEMLKEAEQEGDILFLPTLSLGPAVGFGRKVLMWLAMASRLYPAASFVGKLDDDVLLCLANFAHTARRLKETRPGVRLYWGFINGLARKEQPVSPQHITHNGLRADEQFVLLSQSLARDVLVLGWPPTCDTKLSDYGGATLGDYFAAVRSRLQSPLEVRADNLGMCHHLNQPVEPLRCDGVDVKTEPYTYSPEFCQRHLSAHPNKHVDAAAAFYNHAAVFDASKLEGGEPHNAAEGRRVA
jgi:hypothetical protein